MKDYIIGLDLGQAQDYSALTTVQKVQSGSEEELLHLRHVERFELGTPYPEQVRRVEEVMQSAPLRGRCELVVDQTGAGRPVVDLFKEAGLNPVGVTITGGDSASRAGREHRVPKKELVSTVQTLLQTGRLKFAEGLPLAGVLREELGKFRAKINVSTGHASFEHWREQDHDDVVLALALACWRADRRRRLPPASHSKSFAGMRY